MRPQLDAGKRQEILDQPRHAQGLAAHDLEELLAGRRIVAGRPLQGLDEAEERGERRAQLVARIGDEIDPHVLEAPRRREVAEEQQRRVRRRERPDPHLEAALDRNALVVFEARRQAGAQRAGDAVENVGRPQGEGERLIDAQRREKRRSRPRSPGARRPAGRRGSPAPGSRRGACQAQRAALARARPGQRRAAPCPGRRSARPRRRPERRSRRPANRARRARRRTPGAPSRQ